MEKFGLFRNEQEIGQFSTIANRGEEGFLDEFYAILMTLVPDAGDENLKDKTFIYEVYDTNCLVELDEEPPHKINRDALTCHGEEEISHRSLA